LKNLLAPISAASPSKEEKVPGPRTYWLVTEECQENGSWIRVESKRVDPEELALLQRKARALDWEEMHPHEGPMSAWNYQRNDKYGCLEWLLKQQFYPTKLEAIEAAMREGGDA
jgi:hypothetical protein